MNDFAFFKELSSLGAGVAGVIIVVVLFLRHLTGLTAAYREGMEAQHQEMLEALSNCRRVIEANTLALCEQKIVFEAVLTMLKK